MKNKIAQLWQQGAAIIIPTWNNLAYLKKCVDSIQKHSALPHQIIIHINDGSDGTLQYVKQQNLLFTHSANNEGVCKAVNEAHRSKATRPIVGFANDDMVFLPEWDLRLQRFAEYHNVPTLSWLSSTMIEPTGHNPCCLAPFNFGTSVRSFKETRLLRALPGLRGKKGHVAGTTWPPCFWHTDSFYKVGGFTEEYTPGRGHDPDFAKKLWDIGCRHFLGVGDSLVYHFGSKTIKRAGKNKSKEIFQKLHGMTMDVFINQYLHRGSSYDK